MAIVAAAAAVIGYFTLLRLLAPNPWDLDEYFHVGLARELHNGMPESFRWTPFSLAFARFADKELLFHVLLMPFTGLSIERAALAGAVLGQLLVVGAFAWVLWRLRVTHAPVYLLALAAMGTTFVSRMAMCRPHHGEIGFTILFLGLLLLEAPPLALAAVAAVFGLFHASGWMPVAFAILWLLAARFDPAAPARRRWLDVVATGLGWFAGQCLHPAFPHNLRLLWIQNVTVLGEATAGEEALRSQIGSELQPLQGRLVPDQWPALLAAAVLLVLLATRPHWRRPQVLLTAGLALLALLSGLFLWLRFFELAAPLTLLSIAVGSQLPGSPARRKASRAAVAGIVALILVGGLFTFSRLRDYHVGQFAPPRAMAEWLAGHGRPGERVFTANWADSAPLFYYAPHLQSLVALDPTFFLIADPERFRLYVDLVEGREVEPARAIRERFGARWVTVWKVPGYKSFATRLVRSGQATVAFADPFYLVLDLGEPADRSPAIF
ncbi:MAG TPA: hypothetical protein VF756_18460 [Thermoanaerobaculia bacterium]